MFAHQRMLLLRHRHISRLYKFGCLVSQFRCSARFQLYLTRAVGAVQDLAEYRKYKHKEVSSAARALVALFRQVRPHYHGMPLPCLPDECSACAQCNHGEWTLHKDSP